ncbi:MAG TPA: double-strand break repair helicase AddA [Hyphomicrobiaceae bacterium]
MGFLFPSKLDTAHAQTRRNQAAAADPAASAWVSANAGTGKTHVLTMRVLRLLLGGTPPERILALTYTKAAAAEMSKRVFARLAEWVMSDAQSLTRKLAQLLDRAPTLADIERARQLFAVTIETPGGLKVQTIHAFCERLLQRFPIEAGVPPGFAILDEQDRGALLGRATDEMLAAAAAEKSGPLWRAVQTAIAYAVNGGFDNVLQQALAEFGAAPPFAGEPALAAAQERLRAIFGVRPDIAAEEIITQLSKTLTDDLLPHLVSALRAGNKSDAKGAVCLDAALAANSAERRVEALANFFLTQSNGPRERLLTRKISDERPEIADLLLRAQAQFVPLYGEHKSLMVVEATVALLRLGADVFERYNAAKARSAALDFEDLVGKAAALLASSQAVEWVLYKLDGGLDHILVDEAQDTSPVQWQVIRALAEEFFSGSGARDGVRTLFAVGDEKQSIYSFQGAAPTMFAETGALFARRAELAGLALRRVPLNLSFRATEPLLAAVDLVFADGARTRGVTSSPAPLQHIAHRAGQAGLVEIWPTEKPDQAKPAEPWSPLQEAITSAPVARLAARIAHTINRWLRSGELLLSQNRPIRAGDILILVRKRTPFAAAMISALKAHGIPVAGADRLVLTEQIAVADLMALGDFLCLPQDDLALANLLKSPLFGLDDDALTVLAPKRQGFLWQELLARAATDARFRAPAEILARWLARAHLMPPFEFYAALLDGEGMRARMLERLGAEAADAIDELLNLALSYDRVAAPSLQGFLNWLRQGTRVIKRDMEQGLDEVRVMTVHGAKGLEAPIVFLPDTCSTRSGRSPASLLPCDGPVPFLWPVKGSSELAAVQGARAALDRAEAEERHRLLYVALTRARDRLYVGGFEGNTAPSSECWYQLIRTALRDRLAEATAADGGTVWRLVSPQSAAPEPGVAQAAAPAPALPLPAWAKRPAPSDPLLGVPLAPSKLAPLNSERDGGGRGRARAPAEPATLAPSALLEDARFLRGTLTHALLEHLPSLDPEQWPAAAEAFVAGRAGRLASTVRKSIVAETLAVLREPAFAPLFGPQARAEIPIVAEIAHPQGGGSVLRLTGKIDRLVVTGDAVLIVDYKTNRPPPKDIGEVADAYLLQLCAYRLALARLFSHQRVRAAILWTDGPRIMEIPEQVLDAAEGRLWQLQGANLDA